MTNPRFEVLSIDEHGKEFVEGTFQVEWDAVQYANIVCNYGPTSKDKNLTNPNRIVKLTIRQVWVLND